MPQQLRMSSVSHWTAFNDALIFLRLFPSRHVSQFRFCFFNNGGHHISFQRVIMLACVRTGFWSTATALRTRHFTNEWALHSAAPQRKVRESFCAREVAAGVVTRQTDTEHRHVNGSAF